jgi:hypothetical protein
MPAMSALLLVLTFAVPLIIVALVLVLVFGAVRRAIDRAAEALASEGIELDSGPVTLTTRMQSFRSPELYGGGLRRTPARLVLTTQRLHLLQRPQRYGILERADLGRFTVGILDGKLHLHSTEPPNATGSIDYRAQVDNPDAWVTALTAAGARRAA